MRYTGPALLHLTENEVRAVVAHLPAEITTTVGTVQHRMNAWLMYRDATARLHSDGREVSWNPQTRSHDA